MMTKVGTSVGVGQLLRQTGKMVSKGNRQIRMLGIAMQGMAYTFTTTGLLNVGYEAQDVGTKVGKITGDHHPTTQLFLEKMNNPKQKSIKGPEQND